MCGGAHSALVVLLETFSEVTRTADVNSPSFSRSKTYEYFIEAPYQMVKKFERH